MFDKMQALKHADYYYAEAVYTGTKLTQSIWVLKALDNLESETVKQFAPELLSCPLEAVYFYYDQTDHINNKPWKIHQVKNVFLNSK